VFSMRRKQQVKLCFFCILVSYETRNLESHVKLVVLKKADDNVHIERKYIRYIEVEEKSFNAFKQIHRLTNCRLKIRGKLTG
jgi:hypothetical protein